MAKTNNSEITLKEISSENFWPVIKLKVREDQGTFVASNAISIAEASFTQESWFRAIYADADPVGFVMLYLDESTPEYSLWRYMIDKDHQGKGYGIQAMKIVINYIRDLPGAKEFFLSYVPADGDPSPFYQKLGFIETGEWDDDEKIMKLILDDADRKQI